MYVFIITVKVNKCSKQTIFTTGKILAMYKGAKIMMGNRSGSNSIEY
jgi:hypothetical protein